MDENVFAVTPGYKPEPLVYIEPLDGSLLTIIIGINEIGIVRSNFPVRLNNYQGTISPKTTGAGIAYSNPVTNLRTNPLSIINSTSMILITGITDQGYNLRSCTFKSA